MLLSHSEISEFNKCPQLWYNKYIKKLTPRAVISDGPLAYGIYGHKWLEEYYKSVATGADRETSVAQANKFITSLIMDFQVESRFGLDLLGYRSNGR